MANLTPAEISELDRLEKIIEGSLSNGGIALTQIRDKKLYLRDYESFEGYCQGRWGWSRKRGDQLIRAAAVIKALPDKMLPMVANERQIRELSKVTPEERKIALKALKDSNTPITARAIRKVLSPEQQAEEDIKAADAQNGAPEPTYLDETGLPVPKESVPLWKRGQEVQRLLTALSSVKAAIEKAQEENDPLFRPCTSTNTGGQAQSWATLICGLKDAYHAIKQAKPYAVCPACNGKLFKQCTQCHNRGIVSEHFWKTYTSKETKEYRQRMISKARA